MASIAYLRPFGGVLSVNVLDKGWADYSWDDEKRSSGNSENGRNHQEGDSEEYRGGTHWVHISTRSGIDGEHQDHSTLSERESGRR